MLEVKSLTKHFGNVAALDGVGFTLEAGSLTGILGPNGAGKSTLINILAGTVAPDEGDILFNGDSILKNRRQWRSRIGVVLEDLELFEYLTIGEHLRFCCTLYGLSPARASLRTEELLEFFDLAGLSGTILKEASQGMRKKTAVALALLHSPEILILDESFTGIDSVTAKNLKDLLGGLPAMGVTVLLSSHILYAIEPVISRCIIMREGTIVLDRVIGNGDNLESIYIESIFDGNPRSPRLNWAK
jgi:ABC-2 type transport system ATP-binding protein